MSAHRNVTRRDSGEGVERRNRGRPPAPIDSDRLRTLLSEGISKAAIACQMGVSRRTLYRRLSASVGAPEVLPGFVPTGLADTIDGKLGAEVVPDDEPEPGEPPPWLDGPNEAEGTDVVIEKAKTPASTLKVITALEEPPPEESMPGWIQDDDGKSPSNPDGSGAPGDGVGGPRQAALGKGANDGRARRGR